MAVVDDLFERVLIGLVTRVPGGIVAVLALLVYPGVSLILPIVFHWSAWQFVEANLIRTVLAGVMSLGWLSVQIEAAQRRHLVEWTTNLRLLDAEEFEWLVGEIYRREGWKVEETGRQSEPDGNIDLELSRQGQRKIVQCKRWESWQVNVDEIRRFEGTLFRKGLPGIAGVFVTLSEFTAAARDEAKSRQITLVDGPDLYSKAEKVRRPKPCPICSQPMRLDRSPRGWWMRCVATGCSGKLDLGGEPARAVELITQSPGSAR